ncbi:EscF/YscF/HrpA family type III secretion system needle major subunit [Bradyrhizobium sp. 160]|uniref:EscF/YscF/HrpA family type III secretion system needle major subunit n=1 Tax=Bradyrhizobium sp. 160 TaxID=2782634 RepID=UPI001FF893D3|nr:EscF/YscF/HrpA family type III secretion system needle major subunit [Bradyrhizobium sp. 160]
MLSVQHGCATTADYPPAWRGEVDIRNISGSLGRSVEASERSLRNHMATMNPDDSMDQLKLQISMNTHTTLLSLNSTVIKAVHEALNGIIRNIA